MKKINKRGALGLEVIRNVMLAFLILSVLAIAIVMSLSNIRDVAEDIDTTSVVVVNETFAFGTAKGNLAYLASDSYRTSVCSGLTLVNGTGVTIPATNYTTTNNGCSITGVTGSPFNATAVNASYTALYGNPASNDLTQNITSASVSFFSNAGTIFAILVVVVIILAIAIIIAVVSRFGGSSGSSMGVGSSSGSDTMMGV